MKFTSMCENARLVGDRAVRPFVFADNNVKEDIYVDVTIAFPKVDGNEQAELVLHPSTVMRYKMP